jgi:cytochrome P450
MYPAVGTATTRVSRDADIALDGGRLVIPRGAAIRLHIHSIQNCAANWARPGEFDPDRFLQARRAPRQAAVRAGVCALGGGGCPATACAWCAALLLAEWPGRRNTGRPTARRAAASTGCRPQCMRVPKP